MKLRDFTHGFCKDYHRRIHYPVKQLRWRLLPNSQRLRTVNYVSKKHHFRRLTGFWMPLRKKCTYPELFWPAFSCIRTEYGEILCIHSECGKMGTRITPNTDTFYAVCASDYKPKNYKHLSLFLLRINIGSKRNDQAQINLNTCWEEFLLTLYLIIKS